MHPTKAEFTELYHWYKDTFAFDDDGSIDYYFQTHATVEDCYVIRNEDNEIMSMLFAHRHTMHLQARADPVLFISGVITKKEARGQGWMKRLFQNVFALHSQIAYFVLQAYDANLYTSLGFVQTHFYRWHRVQKILCDDRLREINSAGDLTACAEKWLRQFDGWLDHDLPFYEDQIKEAQAQHQPILGFYQDDQLCAFARCRLESDAVYIEEYAARDQVQEQDLLHMLHHRYSHVYAPIPCTKHEEGAECSLMVRNGSQAPYKNILAQALHKNKDATADSVTSLQKANHSQRILYHYGWW